MVPFSDELGLAPGLHNLFRRLLDFLSKRGVPAARRERPLDPMVVDHETWRVMRRNVRSWPDYREAPNSFRVEVSKPDWDEYWGIDTTRKAESVARYLLKQAADRDLWIAGTPQVAFEASEDVARGGIVVSASFAESKERAHRASADELPGERGSVGPASAFRGGDPDSTMQFQTGTLHPVGATASASPDDTVVAPRARHAQTSRPRDPRATRPLSADETIVLPRATSLVSDLEDTEERTRPEASAEPASAPAKPESTVTEVLPIDVARSAYLLDDGGFRMMVHPGDVIGAVHEGEAMAPDVNIRLDGRGFPDVEARQLSLAATAEGWTITDLAASGTRVDAATGESRVLGPDEAMALSEGDVVYLGAKRPLRFQFGQ